MEENMIELIIEKISLFWVRSHEFIKNQSVFDDVVRLGVEIRQDYLMMQKCIPDIFLKLNEIFDNASDMHVIVLDTLYFVSEDSKCLDALEDLICKEKLDVFLSSALWGNILYERFRKGILSTSYSRKREIHKVLVQMMEKRLRLKLVKDKKRLPIEKRIVLVTDNFLFSDKSVKVKHAPTDMVADFYQSLRYQLGYEVLLLATPFVDKETGLENFRICPINRTYLPQNNGEFSTEIYGYNIDGYQQPIGKKYVNDFKVLISRIEEWRPEFIFCIGGESVIPELISYIAPTIAMPCSIGYAVSEVPHLVSYMGEGLKTVDIMKDYLKENGQKAYQISLPIKEPRKENLFQKTDFGYSEADFVIAIVGNRLDTELDQTFIDLMEQIANLEERVRFLIIGPFTKKIAVKAVEESIKNLGFREDLQEVINVADLFLNPRRAGAGGGAEAALLCKIPVITLGDCDVAATAGERFVCVSYEEMLILVSKYVHDEKFYAFMVKECEKRNEKRREKKLDLELKRLLKQVSEANT